MKRKFGWTSALALALMMTLGACAAPNGSSGSSGGSSSGSSASGSTGTSKVQAYGVIDGGVTLVK